MAVSDEAVWVQCKDKPDRWILSSDLQAVKSFAAAHFCGLQSAHEWNCDPDEHPLYHAGPRKGQLQCTDGLQAIYAWDGDACPTEVMYSSVCRVMTMACPCASPGAVSGGPVRAELRILALHIAGISRCVPGLLQPLPAVQWGQSPAVLGLRYHRHTQEQ